MDPIWVPETGLRYYFPKSLRSVDFESWQLKLIVSPRVHSDLIFALGSMCSSSSGNLLRLSMDVGWSYHHSLHTGLSTPFSMIDTQRLSLLILDLPVQLVESFLYHPVGRDSWCGADCFRRFLQPLCNSRCRVRIVGSYPLSDDQRSDVAQNLKNLRKGVASDNLLVETGHLYVVPDEMKVWWKETDDLNDKLESTVVVE